jgi:hypothetical protein
MKLKNELNFTINRMKKITNLKEYAEELKESKNYNDFETRLAWDAIRAAVGTQKICEWYDKYNCNDSHITTLAKRALKEVYQVR